MKSERSQTQERTWRSGYSVGVVLCAALTTMPLMARAATLYGSSRGGELFVVNTVTGVGTLVGTLPSTTTEIECTPQSTPANNVCFEQFPDGAFSIQRFDLGTAAAAGPVVFDGAAFNG